MCFCSKVSNSGSGIKMVEVSVAGKWKYPEQEPGVQGVIFFKSFLRLAV